MKLLKVFLLSLCVTLSFLIIATAETHVTGPVSGVWTLQGSPFIVDGNLNVPANSTLLIEPGVSVNFSGQYQFQVYGKIIAIGSELDSISFTANTHWHGFRFNSNPDTSHFGYCFFEKVDNSPSEYGGVFFFYMSKGIIEHSTFYNNRANRGAGIYSLWGYGKYTYNVFKDNSVNHCGGALNIGNDSNSLVEKCLLHDNSSSGNPGGAIYVWDDHSRFVNCTIVQNGSPAVLALSGSTTSFQNCIFWDNSSGSGFSVSYSDVQGGFAGTGNINLDPVFVNPSSDDFHLQASSPCIDTGDPASPHDPDGTRVDMGCYYFDQGATTPVVLVSFSGGFTQNGIELSWVTATEIECYGWVVERRNGEAFEAISPTIPGYGTSNEMHNYSFCDPTVIADGTYQYRLKQIDLSGYTTYTEAITVEVTLQPLNYKLVNVYPNPFNPNTTICFSLEKSELIRLGVYDVNGSEVVTLVNGYLSAGNQQLTFDGSSLPSGIYLYRLTTGDQTVVGKMALVK